MQEVEKAEGLPPSNTAALRASKLQPHDRLGQARSEALVAREMEDKTAGAMESAGDYAKRTKCALPYIVLFLLIGSVLESNCRWYSTAS